MKKRLLNIALACLIGVLSVSCDIKNADVLPPVDLMVSEGFKNPIGFYDAKPSFSWKIQSGSSATAQTAYRIVAASSPDLLPDNADLWDSGKIDSDQSVWNQYAGQTLNSRQQVYWQVQFWDQNKHVSAWSEMAYFELGLLQNSDWQGKWISLAPEKNPALDDYGNIVIKPEYLRKIIKVHQGVKKARLYITSKGIFEAYLNGEKVGNDLLTPGYTPYSKRIETLTYDVTEQLRDGENALGIILGEGWYSGRMGWSKDMWKQKPLPKALCQLEITYANGTFEIIGSDVAWKGSRNGPLRYSGFYDGEIYDANMEFPKWATVGFNDASWESVSEIAVNSDVKLAPKRHRAVTIKKELETIAVTEPTKGAFVFDLGQNMVGVPKVQIPVKKNQKVTIRFAEMLQKDGQMYTENYRTAKSTDYYIPKADGLITWQPTFTFHGFRYVELTGFDENAVPDSSWVSGLVYYSDFEQTGIFRSSHDKLNQLQKNIEWGMRGNFLDIPTDCPQRDERMGWTGDAQVFAPTAMFIGDVYAFWSSWLESMREDQDDEGGIPFIVPNEKGKTFSSGWADAATVIPWEIYFRTGDKGVLEENYQMMKKLLGFYQSKAVNNIVNVNTFGDWLQPFPMEKENQRGDTPKDLIGTAYYARSISLTLKAAEVLDKQEDVKALSSLLNDVSKAFENKYLDKNGKLTTQYESQTGYLMALGFGLVSDDMKARVFKHLVTQIELADNHLRTGFLGTPLLAPVLDQFGRSDLMYSILFKETYPSWFYSINQGATTMWERWNSYSHKDGFGKVSMNSFNHYAYGAIGQWMYERIAGLQALEPGYKKILIAPIPGGPLHFAKATYQSPYGLVMSEWKKSGQVLDLSFVIPSNTSALVKVPINENQQVFMDGSLVRSLDHIKIVEDNDANFAFEVKPGTYQITVK